MNNELKTALPVASQLIGEDEVNTVNARQLHEALEIKREFANWIKEQIERAMLVRDSDYAVYDNIVKNSGGRPATEYALTIDSAKHICMMSQTEKGKMIRQYFIECEKKLRMKFALDTITRRDLAAMLLDSENERLEAEKKIRELTPKAGAFDVIANIEGSLCLRETSKLLGLKEKEFLAWLEANKWIFRAGSRRSLLGYADKISAGLLEHKISTYTGSIDREKISYQVRVTPKGITRLAMIFQQIVMGDGCIFTDAELADAGIYPINISKLLPRKASL